MFSRPCVVIYLPLPREQVIVEIERRSGEPVQDKDDIYKTNSSRTEPIYRQSLVEVHHFSGMSLSLPGPDRDEMVGRDTD